MEPGVYPLRNVVEQILHGVIVRPAFAVSARCKPMRRPFDGDELLISALRNVQEVFTIADEIVALHGHD